MSNSTPTSPSKSSSGFVTANTGYSLINKVRSLSFPISSLSITFALIPPSQIFTPLDGIYTFIPPSLFPSFSLIARGIGTLSPYIFSTLSLYSASALLYSGIRGFMVTSLSLSNKCISSAFTANFTVSPGFTLLSPSTLTVIFVSDSDILSSFPL